MPGVTTRRLSHTDYYLIIRRAKGVKGNEKTVLVSYTTSNNALKSGKVLTTAVGNIRSNRSEYV